ncbi:Peptide transporter CstA [bioreactor metagenome]|uniref:Peptide transporter CstA n=1 Tax=bioreactor metagenome TaxID=1076179 RepID=A0A644Y5P2_9ZZZZ
MSSIVLLIGAIILFIAAYATYGSFIAKKWGIDPTRETPAHTLRDDVDYCPADTKVILGHHFSSIAGAGPITGPIQAAVFGWVPVILWIFVGSIFIGGIHDWGALFASIRHNGKSIGEVVRVNIGETGKKVFDIFSWLALVLVVAAFTDICAGTFAFDPATPENLTGAMAGTASILFIFLAMGFGFMVYRRNTNLVVSSVIGVALLFFCIWLGYTFPVLKLSKTAWLVVLLIYITVASVAPVWILLQPRDYLCSFLLYSMIIGAVVGIFVYHPTMILTPYAGFKIGEGAAAQTLFPMLFITVACGAVSGFHSLVGSGTTSKQLNSEKDTKPVGYGAMLLEGVVAVIAVISVAYLADGGTGTPAQKFAAGLATFMNGFGLPITLGKVFVTLTFSAFALTSLDTATRIARYIFQELVEKEEPAKGEKHKGLANMYVATGITVAGAIALLAYGYANIWPIFGASNQLLAGLALLSITAWFSKTNRITWPTFIPMIFMFCVTLTALVILIKKFFTGGQTMLGVIAVILFGLALILIWQGYQALVLKKKKAE